MKHIVLSFLIGLLVLSSCSDWLDIQPKTEVKEDKMFETESGFKDALIGCYMLMGDSLIYGREITYNFLEVLAQQYEFETTLHPYRYVKEYAYSDKTVQNKIDNIWSRMYRVIANVNAILESIETHKDVLHPTNYANIKAEALGLRAFLHFDLLRMFGWGELATKPANLDRLCIPYVTKYSKEMTKQSTVREVLEYIHKDLNESENLLSYYDLYNQEAQDDDYELPNDDGFYNNRRSRFNYYAARATQARVYMWEGKYQEALERASFFIGLTSDPPIAWVNLDNSVINVEAKYRDLSFSTEHIFNLDIYNMYAPLYTYTEQYKIDLGGVSQKDNANYFYHSAAHAEELYEVTVGGNTDQRFQALYDQVDNAHYLFLKFKEVEDSESVGKNKTPQIKKPEMFYYAAECYNRLGQPAQAVAMLNEVRQARGIDIQFNLPATLTSEEIDQEITKEWRKEFINEGQLFYYYKRLGLTIPDATVNGDAAFVIPLPETEVELGGREDYK